MKELEFSLKLKEVPVQITDVDGRVHEYVLRELTGLQRKEYNETLKFDLALVDGKPQISTKEDFKMPSEIDLLTKCLYDENNNPVSKDALDLYPTTAITKLHEAALELSGLDEASRKKAKNGSEVKS